MEWKGGRERERDILVKRPVVSGKDVDHVGSCSGDLVVDLGGRGEEAFAAVCGHIEGVEREDVAEVRVEGLFDGQYCWVA